MTQADSVHSTPPLNTCNVIDFATAYAAKIDLADSSRTLRKLSFFQDREARSLRLKTRKETPSSRNLRLRLARREEWWKAGRVTRYWRARVDWQTALESAQRFGVGDAKGFLEASHVERATLLELWRTALANQMLTPASTLADVEWKRIQLRSGQTRFCPVAPEKFEKAIAEDVEWLAAHPTRNVPEVGGAA